jgi:hypothetical protein
MDRDLEIAENALATIIKQKWDKRQMWLEIKATYTPGYGVTMRIPNDNANWVYEMKQGARAVIAPPPAGTNGSVIVYSSDEYNSKSDKDRDKEKMKKQYSRDSAKAVYYGMMVQASIDFITDYGDLISQLQPDEKILITNRGEGGRWYYDYNRTQKRQLVTVEGSKGDLIQYKQGKLTREQMMGKIKVVNTETADEVETDLELYSSIMGRLYRSDLSKTFYTDESIYYERLKNFGVIYYMSAYSSSEQNRSVSDKGKIWAMPTQRLEGLTQEQRDKKVVELYPQFEKDIKDNMVEYAQTIKSLKEDEMIVFNIQLTKCVGCGIPTTLELSVKNGLVRKLAAGQTTKAEVIAAMNVKKGVAQ